MKFLNDVTITGSGADLSCASAVTFSGLSGGFETYAVMINNSTGVLSKRQLQSNAFTSTTIPTDPSDIGALATTGGTMSGNIAMGSNNITGGGTITGTTLTGTSLDINGNADISGYLDIHDEIVSYAGGAILRKKSDSWSNATTHDVLYTSWGANTGDYVYLKAPGNSTTDHGIAFIGDDVIALGRSDVETGSIDNNSATAPLSENWFVLNSSKATFAGEVEATSLDINGNADISGNLTGVDNITASATIQAEHLYTTDDLVVGDDASITGDLTVEGSTFGLYHETIEDKYYFDDYGGDRNLSLFLKNQRADIIRYQAVENFEYWNGSAWATAEQEANIRKLLDGRQDTYWNVPSTYYKFRFTTNQSSGWPTRANIGIQTGWSGSTWPGCQMLVEHKNTDDEFEVHATMDFGGRISGGDPTALNNNDNNIDNWGLMFKSDSALHDGDGDDANSTRITIDFYGWNPSNDSYQTIPLQNIFITSNYAGTENTDYTNLLDHNRDLTIPGNIMHESDTNTYFGFHTNDQWRVVTGGSERLEVSDSGLKLGNTGATVSSILDQDNMSSNSATALATQQSIKSYVDTQVATRAASSHSHTFSSITSKPTTISGYGITDAFDGAYNSLSGTPTIPSGNQIIDWTTDQGGTNIHTGNYNNTQLSDSQVIAAIVASTDISSSNKASIKTNIGAAYSVAQTLDWSVSQTQNIHTDNLPAASTSAIGGVKIKSTTTNTVSPATLTNTANRTYAVQLGNTSGALVVNVPWSSGVSDLSDLDDATTETRGVMTAEDKTKLDTLNLASSVETISGAKTFSALTTISNTTDSSSATGGNGALRTVGGASIAKKLYVGSTITGSADVIAYSDKKLKENVKTLDGKKVLEMRGVSFDRVDTGKASSGVIAQEMEKVAPELVIDDGNYKGVAYGNLVGYLIEAIKDQQKQINELKYILHGRPE